MNPTNIELRPGNLCNLKCRMCDDAYSNIWGKEIERYRDVKHTTEAQVFLDNYGWGNIKFHNHGENIFKLKDILTIIPTLTDIRFLGGEAMLIEGVEMFINYCIENA